MAIAGHTSFNGVCECGRHLSDLRSIVVEARRMGKPPLGEVNIAHSGTLSGYEWEQMCKHVDEEDERIARAMKDVAA